MIFQITAAHKKNFKMNISFILGKMLSKAPTAKGKNVEEVLFEKNDIISVKCYGERFEKLKENVIDNVTNDSRKSNKKSIFVCIRGRNFDGNSFVGMAEKSGTKVFVSENENLKISRGILIISKNARKTMAELCKIVYDFPQSKMKIIGITGTKGKTTVAELVSRSLRSLGVESLCIGTLGISGNGEFKTDNTTPDSTIIYPALKRAYDSGIRIAVIEVSSQALKDYRVYGVEFDFVAFTCIGYDHVGEGEHNSFSDYIAAKRSLFTSYGAKVAVVNYDDPYSSFFSSGVKKVIHCGITPHSDYFIEDVVFGIGGMKFKLSGTECFTYLPGVYNAVNIAIAAALVKEITTKKLSEIFNVISQIKLPGRFEYYRLMDRDVVIDYAHNEKSLCELIALVRGSTKGRIIAVFGSVGGRSYDRRRELARVAEKFADFSVITSDNPCNEEPISIASDIYSAFSDKSLAKIVLDRKEAIKYAFEISATEDAVLLLGKGHEEYMLVKGEKLYFSERDIIKEMGKEEKSKPRL